MVGIRWVARAAAVAVVGSVLGAGCAPACGQLCRKVLACDIDSERVAFDDCEASCTTQLETYRQWQDQELLDLFEDHRRCISRSSCEEIAAGACYRGYEALFVFDPDKVPNESEAEAE